MSSTKITEFDLDPNMDIAKGAVQQEILDAVTNLETSLTGELTASVVKSVQRGVITFGSGTTKTATINAVDTTKAVVLYGGTAGTGSSEAQMDRNSAIITLTNSTTLTATRNGNVSNTTAIKIAYEVLEFY